MNIEPEALWVALNTLGFYSIAVEYHSNTTDNSRCKQAVLCVFIWLKLDVW